MILAAFAPAALAQDSPIPERFATLQADVDLPGGNLQSIFDVTLERCQSACLHDGTCTGFTFNALNGSCFLEQLEAARTCRAAALGPTALAAK